MNPKLGEGMKQFSFKESPTTDNKYTNINFDYSLVNSANPNQKNAINSSNNQPPTTYQPPSFDFDESVFNKGTINSNSMGNSNKNVASDFK